MSAECGSDLRVCGVRRGKVEAARTEPHPRTWPYANGAPKPIDHYIERGVTSW